MRQPTFLAIEREYAYTSDTSMATTGLAMLEEIIEDFR